MYAQNIDLHLHAADGASGETPGKIYNFNILEVLFSNFPCRFQNPNYVFQYEFYFFQFFPEQVEIGILFQNLFAIL